MLVSAMQRFTLSPHPKRIVKGLHWHDPSVSLGICENPTWSRSTSSAGVPAGSGACCAAASAAAGISASAPAALDVAASTDCRSLVSGPQLLQMRAAHAETCKAAWSHDKTAYTCNAGCVHTVCRALSMHVCTSSPVPSRETSKVHPLCVLAFPIWQSRFISTGLRAPPRELLLVGRPLGGEPGFCERHLLLLGQLLRERPGRRYPGRH